jgi:hypothetical protein
MKKLILFMFISLFFPAFAQKKNGYWLGIRGSQGNEYLYSNSKEKIKIKYENDEIFFRSGKDWVSPKNIGKILVVGERGFYPITKLFSDKKKGIYCFESVISTSGTGSNFHNIYLIFTDLKLVRKAYVFFSNDYCDQVKVEKESVFFTQINPQNYEQGIANQTSYSLSLDGYLKKLEEEEISIAKLWAVESSLKE